MIYRGVEEGVKREVLLFFTCFPQFPGEVMTNEKSSAPPTQLRKRPPGKVSLIHRHARVQIPQKLGSRSAQNGWGKLLFQRLLNLILSTRVGTGVFGEVLFCPKISANVSESAEKSSPLPPKEVLEFVDPPEEEAERGYKCYSSPPLNNTLTP